MSPTSLALFAGAATLGLSLVLPFAVKPVLVRLGIMDVPTARSSHERPILRGLGLAVLIAMLVGYVIALGTAAELAMGVWIPAIVGAGAVLSGLLGLSEDLRGVSVPVRSALLLVIAAGSAFALIWAAQLLADGQSAQLRWVPGLDVTALPSWALILLGVYGVLFVSSYINVANFMDGLNGISGFHGVISGVTFALAGWFFGASWLVAAGLVLAAGFAGFLPWNLTRPGGFLGDVGSYLLGGATAITSFAALVAGVPILATIGPMIIYFGDVGVTLVKRVRTGHKWDEPHKEHVYQRLQQAGRTHVHASAITASFSAAGAGLGLASMFVPPVWWIALLVAGLALVVLYLRVPAGRTSAASSS